MKKIILIYIYIMSVIVNNNILEEEETKKNINKVIKNILILIIFQTISEFVYKESNYNSSVSIILFLILMILLINIWGLINFIPILILIFLIL